MPLGDGVVAGAGAPSTGTVAVPAGSRRAERCGRRAHGLDAGAGRRRDLADRRRRSDVRPRPARRHRERGRRRAVRWDRLARPASAAASAPPTSWCWRRPRRTSGSWRASRWMPARPPTSRSTLCGQVILEIVGRARPTLRPPGGRNVLHQLARRRSSAHRAAHDRARGRADRPDRRLRRRAGPAVPSGLRHRRGAQPRVRLAGARRAGRRAVGRRSRCCARRSTATPRRSTSSRP